ncbi:ThiF family adenylyltransferase [Salibacterium halotolerans]|uniref:Molybdopterin or thiamine biosynthesis adenylyltransferase n=1 Tax=Salibacterium halotolerans TaxID=1884432 RepID=A0A1I5TUY4_9BACI|nr:ThiF family adenylyltransferase [Salibacterium halotolerans]SFP86854.1 Molybdopterin or thiamine biosynthesis adenylyltransferase [Salibacterium halotolerans]
MENRYSRQTMFSGIGRNGQNLLLEKHVLIVGAGALGSAASETLARAGVGRITIIDRDYVEYSNLNRQQLYTESDAALPKPKAQAAKDRLELVNSDITVDAVVGEADPAFLERLSPVDVMIDALDNFDTRMLLNDFSQKHGIPWIYGACVGSYGLTYTILPGESACLHCLMEDIPLDGETCDTVGIIAPAVQMVSAHQTTEAMKLLTEQPHELRKTLLSFDLWTNEKSELQVNALKKADCPSCGEQAHYPFLQYENRAKTEVLCGRDAVQVRPGAQQYLSLSDLKQRYEGQVQKENPYLLVLQLEDKRFVIFQDGRTIIHGENDKGNARTLYQKYIGG